MRTFDEIYTFNLEKNSNESKNEWKLNEKLTMPQTRSCTSYDALLFGDVIIVFYVHNQYDIWCLDLLNDKWYKSIYKVPKLVERKNVYVFKNRDNDDVHLLSFENQLHFVADLNNLLSMEFIKSRRDCYNPLIMGYLKKQENDNLIANIPFVLKQLILNYFPIIDKK